MTPDKYSQVKEVYQAAIDLPPDERSAFVVAACKGDESLRQEVESLLDYQQQAESFIEQSAFEEGARLLIKNDQSDSLVGKRIGQYELLSEVGHGGMGVVYRAERADEQFKKQVAVKLMKLGLDSEEMRRRFGHERQILANIDHPNIAKLLDAGTTQDGRPYLVMDYVEGVSVLQYCDRLRLSVSARLRLFLDVCSAVSYAHQNLVVHRDLKPANVLVTDEGLPKLLDFGIAKLLDAESVESDGHTITQLGAMTPEYASPEQVRGEQVTTATDVYSLGVLLYELLTGHRPYRILSRRPIEMAQVICEQQPTRPSSVVGATEVRAQGDQTRQEEITPEQVSVSRGVSVDRLRRSLAGDLDNIVLKALRKEPQRRYASVSQLAEDIKRHMDGLPVTARTDDVWYRTSKFIARHKIGVVAAAMVVVALAAGLTIATWQARVAAQERDRARSETRKAEQLNQFLRQMLSSADPGARGRDVTIAQVLNDAANRIPTQFANDPETAASLRSTIGMTYFGLGLFDDAEPLLRSALAERQRLLGPSHPDVASSLSDLGMLLTERGSLPEAEKLYREALETSVRTRGTDHVDTAAIMNNLAALLLLKGDLDGAEQMHREALRIRRRLLGDVHAAVAQSVNDLGVVVGTRGQLDEAEKLHREALDISRKLYGTEHISIAAMIATIAAIRDEKGDFADAEALFKEALAMRRKLLGPTHPTVAWTLYNYSYMLWRKGDYQAAREIAGEVLALRGKTLNDEHPMVASSLQVVGRSLMGQDRAKEAESYFRESLELRRRTMPPDHWLIAASESVLGECLTVQKRYADAEPLLTSGYEGLKNVLGEKHPRTAEAQQRLIQYYEATKQTASVR